MAESDDQFVNARVLITSGEHAGKEGVCLGKAKQTGCWFVSADDSDAIVVLKFPRDFGLLVDLSADPSLN